MPSGPGSGVVIHDYKDQGGHFDPPEGADNLDPFAYDVYTVGQTVRETCQVRVVSSFSLDKSTESRQPFIESNHVEESPYPYVAQSGCFHQCCITPGTREKTFHSENEAFMGDSSKLALCPSAD